MKFLSNYKYIKRSKLLATILYMITLSALLIISHLFVKLPENNINLLITQLASRLTFLAASMAIIFAYLKKN